MSEPDPMPQTNGDSPSGLVTGLGLVLYLAAGFPILVGGLIMPGYAVAILGLIWLAGLVIAIRWRHRRPVFFALPFIIVGLWFLTAWAGETFLGWTA